MTTNAEGTTGDYAKDLTALRQDVARLVDTLSMLVQHQARAAGGRVLDVVGDARGKLASTAADAQSGVCAASSAVEARIERHPLTSALIALGVGMSIGLLSRWRV